jgi:hypothetical protein
LFFYYLTTKKATDKSRRKSKAFSERFEALLLSALYDDKREDYGTKLALKWHLQGTDTGINPWYIGIVPNWDWAMNAASGLSGSGFFHARLSGRR